MAIIVEDGSIVADANSYNSLAEALDYFTLARPGVTDWEGFSDETQEGSLRFSTVILGTECWLGDRAQPLTQALDWPRNNVYYRDQQRYFTGSEIPTSLKHAQLELAIALAREDRTLIGETAGGGGLERVKVDVLEIEWMENAAKEAEAAKGLIPDIVYRMVGEFMCYGEGGITTPLYRT